jgi:predicted nucleotidyltransferase
MSTTTPAFEPNITLPRDRIAALCAKYQVEELAVFGSVLRDDGSSGFRVGKFT